MSKKARSGVPSYSSKKVQDLILQEIRDIKGEIKEVRQLDIPNLKTELAVVKTQSSQAARVIAGIGGAIAVGTSAAIAFLR
jgi:hypothetical protein